MRRKPLTVRTQIGLRLIRSISDDWRFFYGEAGTAIPEYTAGADGGGGAASGAGGGRQFVCGSVRAHLDSIAVHAGAADGAELRGAAGGIAAGQPARIRSFDSLFGRRRDGDAGVQSAGAGRCGADSWRDRRVSFDVSVGCG